MLQRLKTSEFTKLSLGGLVASLLSGVTALILTRIYSPSDFGYYSKWFAVLTPLTPLATLGLVDAVYFSKSDFQAYKLVSTFIVFGASVGLFFSIAFLALALVLKSDYFLILSLISLPFFVLTSSNTFIGNLCIRLRKTSLVAKASILNAIFSTIIKLLGGWLVPSSATLAISNLACDSWRLFVSLKIISKIITSRLKKNIVLFALRPRVLLRQLTDILLKYKNLSLNYTIESFFALAFASSPVVLLSSLTSVEIVGSFAYINSILSLVISPLASALYSLEIRDLQLSYKTIRRSTFRLIAIAILLGYTGHLILPYIFEIALPKKWFYASQFSSYLIFVPLFSMANKPVVAFLRRNDKNHVLVAYQVFAMAFLLISMYFCITIFPSDYYALIKSYSIIMCCSYLALIMRGLYLAKTSSLPS